MKAVCLALFVVCAGAQTTGLPHYGVLLEGIPDQPRIVNHSQHRILAYAIRYDNAKTSTVTSFLAAFRTRPIAALGIPPGATVQLLTRRPEDGGVPHTSAALDAILFEDASLLGPDQGGMFDRLTGQVRVEQKVAAFLLNGVATNDPDSAWRIVQEIASFAPDPRTRPFSSLPLGPESKAFAAQLLRVRDAQGEAAALQLAESAKNYPVIVKGE